MIFHQAGDAPPVKAQASVSTHVKALRHNADVCSPVVVLHTGARGLAYGAGKRAGAGADCQSCLRRINSSMAMRRQMSSRFKKVLPKAFFCAGLTVCGLVLLHGSSGQIKAAAAYYQPGAALCDRTQGGGASTAAQAAPRRFYCRVFHV